MSSSLVAKADLSSATDSFGHHVVLDMRQKLQAQYWKWLVKCGMASFLHLSILTMALLDTSWSKRGSSLLNTS